MKITRAVVPSLFTVLNIFCGFSAVVQTAAGAYHQAAWFIILAAVFDTLDGVMARITKSSSSFGVEFDSLSDVVSFGLAPSFLVYQSLLFRDGGLGLIPLRHPRGAPWRQSRGHFSKNIRASRFRRRLTPSHTSFYADTTGFTPLRSTAAIRPGVAAVSTIRYDMLRRYPAVRQHPLRFTLWWSR